jgi:hypothetical protein
VNTPTLPLSSNPQSSTSDLHDPPLQLVYDV